MQNAGAYQEKKQPIRMVLHFLVMALFSVSFIFALPVPSQCFGAERRVAAIHLDHRPAEEMVPMVQGLLSSDGTASADTRNNSLVVVDTPPAIQRIRGFLEGFDYPIEQVRIRVRFTDNRIRDRFSATADGKISGKDWEVSSGDRENNGIAVRLEGKRGKQQGTSEYSLTVSSGSAAYITAGTSIPYEQKWFNLCRSHGHVIETTEFRDIETGFEVSPVLAGDRAHIQITPRLSYQDPEAGEGAIRFTEASTSMTVLLNRWTSIGGAMDDDNEVAREILGYGSGGSKSAFSISLMVEKP